MRGAFAVGVVGRLPDVLRPSVGEHVARAGVEAEGGGVGRQDADVGNAADVEHDAGFVWRGKHSLMEGGHEGCALAACGDVAAAEVPDGGDAGEFGQKRQVGELDAVSVSGGVAYGWPWQPRAVMSAGVSLAWSSRFCTTRA